MNLIVDRYLDGFWAVVLGSADGSARIWCAALRRVPGGGYTIESRMDVVPQGGDFRRVASRGWRANALPPGGGRGDALWHVRAVVLTIADLYGAEVIEVLMNRERDPDAFVSAYVKQFARQPWVRSLDHLLVQG